MRSTGNADGELRHCLGHTFLGVTIQFHLYALPSERFWAR